MKTRREFFKTLAGSCAVVVACVVAPKSLMAKEPENPFNLENVKEGLEKMDHVTSGYAQVVDGQGNSTTWTIEHGENVYTTNVNPYLWKYADVDVGWRKA